MLLTRVVTSPTSIDWKTDYFSLGDSLPPFSTLTSDEEREKKAEAFSPGTYHVVVTPDSFSSLPEYADEEPQPASVCRASATNSPTSAARSEFSTHEDPNVIILKTFEDATRRSPSHGKLSKFSPTSEISDPFCNMSLSPIFPPPPSPGIKIEDMSVSGSRLDQKSQESTLFSHFRHVVWKQLFPHDHSLDDSCASEGHFMTLSVDFLEQEATRFPPVSIF